MVVLAMGHERQRIHERHRPVVILEGERPDQRMAIFRQLPARHLRQQLPHVGIGQAVLAATAGHAMGLGKGNQVCHVHAPAMRREAPVDWRSETPRRAG